MTQHSGDSGRDDDRPRQHVRHSDLAELAHQAMIDHGLEPDYPPDTLVQLETITGPADERDESIRDLTQLLWCSIDNDDSRDLDQLTVAEELGAGNVRVMVAVADVDSLVKKGTPIDKHAQHNTTSVYTAARIFPMLPEKLSTDFTSLNDGEDRLAVVLDMVVQDDGSVKSGDVYRARVHNHAKLAYNSVASWLDGEGDRPEPIGKVPGLEKNLRLQDRIATQLREKRHEQGALDLDTIEARPVIRDGKVVDLKRDEPNRAKQLIEDFMIAANGTTARFLDKKGFASIRRVVRSPERWDRIEAIAAELGERLPPDPDAQALEEFLVRRRKADPLRFPDLSLTIVKAMGAGEYVLDLPGQEPPGHFGLAVRDYTHSTAPNRRYPDLIAQRLVKAALAGQPSPYSDGELGELATHCTEQEDAANKVERQIRKSAAAAVLAPRVGERFDGIVTGAGAKGTWIRIFHPPVEGKLVHGHENLDIGDKVHVKLIDTDVERGFIDFVRSGH
jgi:VacB/RNase II family 3'-5' exoribonuclease